MNILDKTRLLQTSILSTLILGVGGIAYAQTTDVTQVPDAVEDEFESANEIVVTGSRIKRDTFTTTSPLQVLDGTTISEAGFLDLGDALRTTSVVQGLQLDSQLNSVNVTEAGPGGQSVGLRGLGPERTLILINGRRFAPAGIEGAPSFPDISLIPSSAIERNDILLDGASSVYGSDAIAGVINFQLKDASEGGSVEVQYGSTYAGDGDNFNVSGNVGLPLGEDGFINITAEYGDVDGTSRSIIRPDVAGLIAAGNADAADFLTINTFTDEVPQYWGQPDVKGDLKLFVNSAVEIDENVELYAFGSYAEREVQGGFFYRNPTNRGGVYAGPTVDAVTGALDPNGVSSVLVGDLDGLGVGGACPAGIPLTAGGGLIPDPTVLAAVTADPNCFSFVETIPGGFTPRFGGNSQDFSIVGGLRGELDWGTGLQYDFSASYGTNSVDFFINNSINASLGPNSPRDFVPGGQEQIETNLNADFVYALETGLASDLNIGFGAEYRNERFDLNAGDAASFALGPLASQGFS